MLQSALLLLDYAIPIPTHATTMICENIEEAVKAVDNSSSSPLSASHHLSRAQQLFPPVWLNCENCIRCSFSSVCDSIMGRTGPFSAKFECHFAAFSALNAHNFFLCARHYLQQTEKREMWNCRRWGGERGTKEEEFQHSRKIDSIIGCYYAMIYGPSLSGTIRRIMIDHNF